MAKLTTTTITSGYGTVDALNNNFDLVEAAVENTLSRDGTSPNTMSANLDMNSNRVVNLPTPVSAAEGANKAYVDAVAAAFNDGTTLTSMLADSSDVAKGDALVAFKQSTVAGAVAGATAKTVHEKLQEFPTVKDTGATGNGSTNDTTAIQAAFDAQATSIGKQTFPPKATGGTNYLISAAVDLDNPSYSEVDARGVKITASHDGVAFNLNPTANPADPQSTLQHDVTWEGGHILGTAVAPASSVGIRAYAIRSLHLKPKRVQGFKSGVQVNGLDTLRIGPTHFFGNGVDVDVPQWQTVVPNQSTIDLFIDHTHHSCSGGTSAIKVRDYFQNIEIVGGSCNGAWSGPAIDIHDYNPVAAQPLRGVHIHRKHFEQLPASGTYVRLDDTNARGFTGVTSHGNTYGDSPALGVALDLQRCANVDIRGDTYAQTGIAITGNGTTNGVNVTSASPIVTFSGTAVTTGMATGQYFFAPGVPYGRKIQTVDSSTQVTLDGNADGTFTFTYALANVSTPILLDANCTNVSIGPNQFSTGRVVYLCARKEVTFEPEFRQVTVATPITGFDGVAKSTTGSTTIDMRVAIASIWPAQGVPKAYAVTIVASDSASEGSATTVEAQLLTPGDVQARCLRLQLAGLDDGELSSIGGIVAADKYGNINWRCVATGAGTMTLYFIVNGYFM